MSDNESRFREIQRSKDGHWLFGKKEDRYYFVRIDGDDPVVIETNNGRIINTLYPELASRMFEELEIYGYEAMTKPTIMKIHTFLLDNIDSIFDIATTYHNTDEWTFDYQGETKWETAFGEKTTRLKEMATWLAKCTHMQLSAIIYIANEYNSLNVAYILATALESPSKYESFKTIHDFAELISEIRACSFKRVNHDFKLFEMYYGIHVLEDGPIINPGVEVGKKDGIVGNVVTKDALVGRNYYLYVDGVIKSRQPISLKLQDLELDINRKEPNIHKEDTDLTYLIPGEYWVKRIRANTEAEQNYFIAIKVDKAFEIKACYVMSESVMRMGGGFFVIPGEEIQAYRSFNALETIPEMVMAELDLLISNRYLTKDFSFIGKKLPNTMIEENINGGSNTEYTYALQSPYRSAYTHMTVYTDEEGIIEDFSYESYYSTGSSWGDMFSRPKIISDRKDEAIETLLFIIDHYTNKEYNAVL